MIEQFIQNNIIGILFAIFSAGGVYSLVQFKLRMHERRISSLEERNEDIVKIKVDLIWIKEALVDIKKKLEEL